MDARGSLDYYRLAADPSALRAAGLFIVEGRHAIVRLLRTPLDIVSLLLTPAALDSLDGQIQHHDGRVIQVAPDRMRDITGFNFHRGALALVRRPAMREPVALIEGVPSDGVIVIAEHLVDVDNVGSAFRNARGFGASCVLLDQRCADPLYRKAVRTSMGAVLEMPWAQADSTPMWSALDMAGVATIALTPQADAMPLEDACAAVHGTRPLALVIGNEGTGLADATLARATRRACIPMAPGADSLNVATALAIALYAVRTRQAKGGHPHSAKASAGRQGAAPPPYVPLPPWSSRT